MRMFLHGGSPSVSLSVCVCLSAASHSPAGVAHTCFWENLDYIISKPAPGHKPKVAKGIIGVNSATKQAFIFYTFAFSLFPCCGEQNKKDKGV